MPIANICQYRKSIGTYNNKPHSVSDKSICKAIRKARCSYEPINTRSNSANTNHSIPAVRALLMVGLAASVIGTSAAISNGQSRESSKLVRDTFPYLGLSSGSTCSSVRLNNRQLLTAKHCTSDGDYPWAWTNNGWDWAARQLYYPDKNVDLALITFDTSLRGEAYCFPIMSKETRGLLKNNAKDACGVNAPMIVLGNGITDINGVSERRRCLNSAVFDFDERLARYSDYKDKNKFKRSSIKGVSPNDKPVYAGRGDSGGAVMGCNPKTNEYELMGIDVAIVNAKNKKDKSEQLSLFVDIAYYSEINDWIQNNTKAYSCSGETIKAQALYDPNYNYENNHGPNECNISLSFPPTGFAAVSLFCVASVAGLAAYFYKKREQNFQAVAIELAANENNEEVELEDIVTG